MANVINKLKTKIANFIITSSVPSQAEDGCLKLYAKADGNIYTIDSSSNEIMVNDQYNKLFTYYENISVGSVVSVIDNQGTVNVQNIYRGVGNIDYASSIGVAQETKTAGQIGRIELLSGISTIHSGLTVGTKCYIQTDGTISQNQTTHIIGIAISSTQILLNCFFNIA